MTLRWLRAIACLVLFIAGLDHLADNLGLALALLAAAAYLSYLNHQPRDDQ